MAFFSGGDDRIKLITLYILKEFRTPITWEQLYTALAYQDGPDFFETGELYSELVAGGYIACVPAKGQQLLSLTEKGASVCGLFGNEIARSVRDSIDAFAEERRAEYMRRNCVVSDAKPLPSGAWQLELALLDNGGSMLELNMRMPDSAYAYRAQRHWEHHAEEIYMRLLTELTSDDAPTEEYPAEPDKNEPRAGLANPVRRAESIGEVNAAVGCRLPQMPGASDERFSRIAAEPPLGQYCFALDGAEYTLRASRSEDDITGVWVSGGTLTEAAGGKRTIPPTEIEGNRFTRFFIDDTQYALYSGSADEAAFRSTAERVFKAIN